MSSNTSVVGGALAGGFMGLAGGRYGSRGFSAGMSSYRHGGGIMGSVGAMGRGIYRGARADVRSAMGAGRKLWSNSVGSTAKASAQAGAAASTVGNSAVRSNAAGSTLKTGVGRRARGKAAAAAFAGMSGTDIRGASGASMFLGGPGASVPARGRMGRMWNKYKYR